MSATEETEVTEAPIAPPAAPTPVEVKKTTPSAFLTKILGRPVTVLLNSGTTYKGILACLDGYMNIAMEQTEEYENGQLKAKFGDAFIRGNNVLYIAMGK